MSAKLLENECNTTTGCILYFTVAPALYILVACLTVFGNVLTILSVYKTPRLQTLPNLYIVSLAGADCLTGIYMFSIAFLHIEATHEYMGHTKEFCLFMYVISVISVTASNFNIVCIALDRYIYIIHPFAYTRLITLERTRVIILVSWLAAILLGLLAIQFNTFDAAGECSFIQVLDYVYQFLCQTLVFLLTVASLCFLYLRIFKVALHQSRAIAASGQSTDRTWRQNMRTVKLLMMVCGVFILCWSPTHIFMIVTLKTRTFTNVFTFLSLFGLLNSTINFIIYPLMNKDFRKAFRALLCCNKGTQVEPFTTPTVTDCTRQDNR